LGGVPDENITPICRPVAILTEKQSTSARTGANFLLGAIVFPAV
jgi:hypothetical protein